MNLFSAHIYWIIFPLVAYLIGSLPFGKLISQKVAGIDIAERGSGNIGATNVARELGLKWGILTLILDGLKGFIPLFLFSLFYPNFEVGLSIVGLSTLLGHQFSLFQRFRGGKGVATALGIYLALSPANCLVAILFFILTVRISNFISLGSMVSASIMPILLMLNCKSETLIITSLIIAALICLKHKDNIQRLVEGNERRWRKRDVMPAGQEVDPFRHRNKNR